MTLSPTVSNDTNKDGRFNVMGAFDLRTLPKESHLAWPGELCQRRARAPLRTHTLHASLDQVKHSETASRSGPPPVPYIPPCLQHRACPYALGISLRDKSLRRASSSSFKTLNPIHQHPLTGGESAGSVIWEWGHHKYHMLAFATLERRKMDSTARWPAPPCSTPTLFVGRPWPEGGRGRGSP